MLVKCINEASMSTIILNDGEIDFLLSLSEGKLISFNFAVMQPGSRFLKSIANLTALL